MNIVIIATSAMKKCERRGNKIWRLIAKSLGEKSGKSNKEADQIAFIRLIITLQILITNFVIISGVIRHWNDIHYTQINHASQKN